MGRIVPLVRESLGRLQSIGCTECTFVTPVAYTAMVRLIRRRIAPWAKRVAETRESVATLEP